MVLSQGHTNQGDRQTALFQQKLSSQACNHELYTNACSYATLCVHALCLNAGGPTQSAQRKTFVTFTVHIVFWPVTTALLGHWWANKGITSLRWISPTQISQILKPLCKLACERVYYLKGSAPDPSFCFFVCLPAKLPTLWHLSHNPSRLSIIDIVFNLPLQCVNMHATLLTS